VWHGRESGKDGPDKGHELAKAIYSRLGGEWLAEDGDVTLFGGLPAVQAEIPVFFYCSEKPRAEELDRALLAHPAERSVVLLLADDRMIAFRDFWQPVVASLGAAARKDRHLHMALVQIAKEVHNYFAETTEKKSLAIENQLDWIQCGDFYVRLIGLLYAGLTGERTISVFVSHTQKERSEEAKRIRAYLQDAPLLGWLAEERILEGEDIREVLLDELPRSFFLAVVTPGFVRHRWTRWEAAIARQHGRPLAIIDLLEGQVRRLPPELANAPVLRWPATEGPDLKLQLRGLVLTEALRHAVHSRRIGILAPAVGVESSDSIVATVLPPGPIVEHGKADVRVYADPPLTHEELAVQRQYLPSRFVTTAQFVAERGWRSALGPRADSLNGLPIGLSVSFPREPFQAGVFETQFDDLSVRIARALVFLGARLVYGGDLRPDGITVHLARMVDQYAPEKHVPSVLQAFVAWPFWLSWSREDLRQRLEHLTPKQIEPGPLPEGINRDSPPDGKTIGGVVAVAQSLTKMRREMSAACHARIAVGGPAYGGMGRMPGVLEEVWLALNEDRKPQPIYLVGGFGGAARALFDAISGRPTEVFTLEARCRPPRSKYLDLVDALKQTEDRVDWESVASKLGEFGLEGLAENNGLKAEENQRLAETRNPNEILYLLAKGLGARFGAGGP
jgi:hypothetical protein